MPRRQRLHNAGLLHHVVSKGNDRQKLFLSEKDFRRYIFLLKEGRKRLPVKIYNYVLLDNNLHLLLEPLEDGCLSKFMEFVSKEYAKYFNKTYTRTGHVFEGRFKSFIIQPEQYFLACSRYIDLNPVKTKLCKTPRDYKWSAHKTWAYGDASVLDVDVHDFYKNLGHNEHERQIAYRALVSNAPGEDLDLLNRRSCVLGTKEFKVRLKPKK